MFSIFPIRVSVGSLSIRKFSKYSDNFNSVSEAMSTSMAGTDVSLCSSGRQPNVIKTQQTRSQTLCWSWKKIDFLIWNKCLDILQCQVRQFNTLFILLVVPAGGGGDRNKSDYAKKFLSHFRFVLGIYRLMFVFEPFARYHFPRRVISNPFVVCFKFTTFAVTSFFICYWMRESPGVSANVCEAVGRNSFLFPVNCFILPDKSHHQRVNMSILFDRILLIVP